MNTTPTPTGIGSPTLVWLKACNQVVLGWAASLTWTRLFILAIVVAIAGSMIAEVLPFLQKFSNHLRCQFRERYITQTGVQHAPKVMVTCVGLYAFVTHNGSQPVRRQGLAGLPHYVSPADDDGPLRPRMAGLGSRTLYFTQPSAAVGRSARNL